MKLYRKTKNRLLNGSWKICSPQNNRKSEKTAFSTELLATKAKKFINLKHSGIPPPHEKFWKIFGGMSKKILNNFNSRNPPPKMAGSHPMIIYCSDIYNFVIRVTLTLKKHHVKLIECIYFFVYFFHKVN